MKIAVRIGRAEDVDAAVSVYERSNLARRGGDWPSRDARLRHVASNLRDPTSWFIVAHDGPHAVAMAVVLPFRSDDGAGPLVPGTGFLDLIYVLPERWGERIGGAVLDAVVQEAARRRLSRLILWTHERDNDRAQRLYRSRGFARTGRTRADERGERTEEWARDV